MTVKALPFLLAVASYAACGGVASARDDQALSYTIEDVRACARDAMRLCRDKLPDNEAIEACMRVHFDQLGPACQARFSR